MEEALGIAFGFSTWTYIEYMYIWSFEEGNFYFRGYWYLSSLHKITFSDVINKLDVIRGKSRTLKTS